MLALILFHASLMGIAHSKHGALSGHQIWEVDNTVQDFRLLQKTLMALAVEGKLDILDTVGNKTHFRVFPNELENVAQHFEEEELKVNVKIKDLERFIDEEEEREKAYKPVRSDLKDLQTCTLDQCSKPLTNEYMDFEQIGYYLSSIKAEHSPRVSVTSIGKTEEGRDVWLVNIKGGRSTSQGGIFIEGGIHAREWISPAVALNLIQYLIENPEVADEFEINIVPMANPDGYVYSYKKDRYWRKNRASVGRCKGVDLNRNWGYKWGVGASSSICSEIYKGKTPFSEPETKAISQAMRDTPSLKFLLSLHSYGQMLIYPWGWTTQAAPDVVALKSMGDKIADAMFTKNRVKYSVENSAAGLYFASGTTDDWAKAILKVKYSYTLELRDKGNHGFLLPAKHISATSAEVWLGLQAAIENLKLEG